MRIMLHGNEGYSFWSCVAVTDLHQAKVRYIRDIVLGFSVLVLEIIRYAKG